MNITTERGRRGDFADRIIEPSGHGMIEVDCRPSGAISSCSAPARHRGELRAHGAKSVAQALTTLLAVLREIFDEAAYDRYLAQNRASRSVSSYREFLRQRETVVARKPRCC
jgi:hypothetical protein